MSTVEEAVTDHAERLDVFSDLFAMTNTRFVEQESALKASTTQVDHDLREHVKAQDAHSQHRLDALETKLSQTLDELDVELREHTKVAIKNLADRVHVTEVSLGTFAGNSGGETSDLAQAKLNQLEYNLKTQVAEIERLLQVQLSTGLAQAEGRPDTCKEHGKSKNMTKATSIKAQQAHHTQLALWKHMKTWSKTKRRSQLYALA